MAPNSALQRTHSHVTSRAERRTGRATRRAADGDERLTVWMQENLEVGVHATGRYEDVETALVAKLRPLLNLTKWANPDAPVIKQLRKVCADEARASRLPGPL